MFRFRQKYNPQSDLKKFMMLCYHSNDVKLFWLKKERKIMTKMFKNKLMTGCLLAVMTICANKASACDSDKNEFSLFGSDETEKASQPENTLNRMESSKLNKLLQDAHESALNELSGTVKYDESLSYIDKAIRKFNDNAYNKEETGRLPSYLLEDGISQNLSKYSNSNWNFVMLQEYMRAEAIYGSLGFMSNEQNLSAKDRVKNRAQFAVDNALNCFSEFRKYKDALTLASKDIVQYMLLADMSYDNVTMAVSKRKARVSANETTYKNGDYDRSSTYNNARVFAQEKSMKRHTDDMEMNVNSSSAYNKFTGDYEQNKNVSETYSSGTYKQQTTQNKGNINKGTYDNNRTTHIKDGASGSETFTTEKSSKTYSDKFSCHKISNSSQKYVDGKQTEYNINEYYTDVLTSHRVLTMNELAREVLAKSKYEQNKHKVTKLQLVNKYVVPAKKRAKDMNDMLIAELASRQKTGEVDTEQMKSLDAAIKEQLKQNETNLMIDVVAELIQTQVGNKRESKQISELFVKKVEHYNDPSIYTNDDSLSYIAYRKELDDLYDLVHNFSATDVLGTLQGQIRSNVYYSLEQLLQEKERIKRVTCQSNYNTPNVSFTKPTQTQYYPQQQFTNFPFAQMNFNCMPAQNGYTMSYNYNQGNPVPGNMSWGYSFQSFNQRNSFVSTASSFGNNGFQFNF